MQTEFRLFGPIHLAILGATGALPALLAWRTGSSEVSARRTRIGLALALVLNSIAWYGFLAVNGWLEFPQNLPMQLCDATLVLTVVALLTVRPLIFDLAYYGALAGTTMALVTPDLWEPVLGYSTMQFFVAHSLVVAGVLYLVWSGQARPRPRSIWKALLAVNIFAGAAATLNFLFGTNYMYLRARPDDPSLLDYLGPWPWYVLSGEAIALALFALLYLPFRRRNLRATTERNAGRD